jgi:opacity protein-like surface antigen
MLLISSAAVLRAEDTSGKLYLNGDVGVALMQDVTINKFNGTPVPYKVSLDPGIRFDLGVGYNITDSLAAEVETGLIWNPADLVYLGSAWLPFDMLHVRADIYQIPFLVNAIYRIPLKSGLTPYIGVGVGADFAIVDFSMPGISANYNDVTFAYQGIAGVKYAVTKNIDVGLAYKFLGTLDHSWNLLPGVRTDTAPTMTHSILATLTWRF